jgi:low temperature requirement protein LtrA
VVIAIWGSNGFPWWVVATAAGLFAPFFMPRILKWAGKPEMENPPVKTHYVLDRFGELTIIVLAEFFLKAALGAAERESYLITSFYGLGLLVISVGIWWLFLTIWTTPPLPEAMPDLGFGSTCIIPSWRHWQLMVWQEPKC